MEFKYDRNAEPQRLTPLDHHFEDTFLEGEAFYPSYSTDTWYIKGKRILPNFNGLFPSYTSVKKYYKKKTISGVIRWGDEYNSGSTRSTYSGTAILKLDYNQNGSVTIGTLNSHANEYSDHSYWIVDTYANEERYISDYPPIITDHDVLGIGSFYEDQPPTLYEVEDISPLVRVHRAWDGSQGAVVEIARETLSEEVTLLDLIDLAANHVPDLSNISNYNTSEIFQSPINGGVGVFKIILPTQWEVLGGGGEERYFQLNVEKVTSELLNSYYDFYNPPEPEEIAAKSTVSTSETWELSEPMMIPLDEYGEITETDNGWNDISWKHVERYASMPRRALQGKHVYNTVASGAGQAAITRYMIRGENGPYTIKGYYLKRYSGTLPDEEIPVTILLDEEINGGWWVGEYYAETSINDNPDLYIQWDEFRRMVRLGGCGIWDNDGTKIEQTTSPTVKDKIYIMRDFEDLGETNSIVGMMMQKTRYNSYIGYPTFDGSPGRFKKRIYTNTYVILPQNLSLPNQTSMYGEGAAKNYSYTYIVTGDEEGINKSNTRVMNGEILPPDYMQEKQPYENDWISPTEAGKSWEGETNTLWTNIFPHHTGKILSVEKLSFEIVTNNPEEVMSPEIRIDAEPGKMIELLNASVVMLKN